MEIILNKLVNGVCELVIDKEYVDYIKLKPESTNLNDFNTAWALLCCKPKEAFFDFNNFKFSETEQSLINSFHANDFSFKLDRQGFDNHVAIMYSGGVDSIAASLLYEKSVKIFAGYGGWFERESKIIELLGSDFIIETNIRMNSVLMDKERPQEKIIISRKSPWTFVLANYFLTLSAHNSGCVGVGTILEASPILNLKKITPASIALPLLRMRGVNEYSPTRGLTEITTSLLASHENHDNFDKIISSTSAFGSPKYLRKKLIQILVDDVVNNRKHEIDFVIKGKIQDFIFADKFLLPAFKKWLGHNFINIFPDVDCLKVPDIPDLRNSIYFKFNEAPFADRYGNIEYSFTIFKLGEFGVYPYSDNDYDQYCKIRDFAIG
jgi:hypothetical protein